MDPLFEDRFNPRSQYFDPYLFWHQYSSPPYDDVVFQEWRRKYRPSDPRCDYCMIFNSHCDLNEPCSQCLTFQVPVCSGGRGQQRQAPQQNPGPGPNDRGTPVPPGPNPPQPNPVYSFPAGGAGGYHYPAPPSPNKHPSWFPYPAPPAPIPAQPNTVFNFGGGSSGYSSPASQTPSPGPAPAPDQGPIGYNSPIQPGPDPSPSPGQGPAPSPGPAPGPSPSPGPAFNPSPSPAPAFDPSPSPAPGPVPAPGPMPAPVPAPVPGPQPGPVPGQFITAAQINELPEDWVNGWPQNAHPPSTEAGGNPINECDICRVEHPNYPCDAWIGVSPGVGCTYCKKTDRSCRWGLTLLAPRPDGMTEPISCDQCVQSGILACSWRNRATGAPYGPCNTCVNQGRLCTHGGVDASQLPLPNHTHLTATVNLSPYNNIRPRESRERQTNMVPSFNSELPRSRSPPRMHTSVGSQGQHVALSDGFQRKSYDPNIPRRVNLSGKRLDKGPQCLTCASKLSQGHVYRKEYKCDAVHNKNGPGSRGCTDCARWGLQCVTEGVALPPTTVPNAGTNADQVHFSFCEPCKTHRRPCDRKRPCDSCVIHGDTCRGGSLKGVFYRGVPGDDQRVYYRRNGFGDGGVYTRAPSGPRLQVPLDYHLLYQPSNGQSGVGLGYVDANGNAGPPPPPGQPAQPAQPANPQPPVQPPVGQQPVFPPVQPPVGQQPILPQPAPVAPVQGNQQPQNQSPVLPPPQGLIPSHRLLPPGPPDPRDVFLSGLPLNQPPPPPQPANLPGDSSPWGSPLAQSAEAGGSELPPIDWNGLIWPPLGPLSPAAPIQHHHVTREELALSLAPLPGMTMDQQTELWERLIESDYDQNEVEAHEVLTAGQLLDYNLEIVDSAEEYEELGGEDLVAGYATVWGAAQYMMNERHQILGIRTIRRRLRLDMLAKIPADQSHIVRLLKEFLEIRNAAHQQRYNYQTRLDLNLPGIDLNVAEQLNPGNWPLYYAASAPFNRPASPGPNFPVFFAKGGEPVLKDPPEPLPEGHPALIQRDLLVRPIPPHPNPTAHPALAYMHYTRPHPGGRMKNDESMQCTANRDGEPCKRPTNLACEDTRHAEAVPICLDCELRSRERFHKVLVGILMAIRAFACAECIEGQALDSATYNRTGHRVYATCPDPSGAVPECPSEQLGLSNTGGYTGRHGLMTGCFCATKLLGRVCCSPHRLQYLISIDRSVTALDDWVQQTYGRKSVCPFCRERPGIDAFAFQGPQGGEGKPKVWMCKACHDVVIDDVGKEPYIGNPADFFGGNMPIGA
ncbi:hypothetical protein F4774DRAFT_407335 [Daldinia eschscholtzii]|nr:hypothetical protein F4774DRAFT_407335 [Daldinia eschscholtzii]